MRNFQKKRKMAGVMESKFFLIFLGVVILIFSYSMLSFIKKMEETTRNKKVIEDKITELEKTKEKLNDDISKLKTEKGVEENIREKFGLAKEGESMIMVVDDDTNKIEKKTDSQDFMTILKNWFK